MDDPTPEYLEIMRKFEAKFTVDDWNVMRRLGTARARGLMAIIDELAKDRDYSEARYEELLTECGGVWPS